jgi:hypothetical protein
MKKKIIKKLDVTVTYRVCLGNVEVSGEILKKLDELYGAGKRDHDNNEHADAIEWLNDNISERDACDWSFEINDLEYDEDEKI